MTNSKLPKEIPIVCLVVTELQAAKVAKICQDYGIQSIIKMKPFVDISQLKKVVKSKMKARLYDPCPCGKGRKYKFCCYKNEIKFEI